MLCAMGVNTTLPEADKRARLHETKKGKFFSFSFTGGDWLMKYKLSGNNAANDQPGIVLFEIKLMNIPLNSIYYHHKVKHCPSDNEDMKNFVESEKIRHGIWSFESINYCANSV